MLAKEDIPSRLQNPVNAATAWINSVFEANFEVTGLADAEVPNDISRHFELGIILCDGEICERKQIAFEPTASGFTFALSDSAQAEKRVVRLKGGDGLIFGRGGEEIDEVEAAGLDWVVIPGVTAASGAAAALNMALTHRDYSQAVTLITAQRRRGGFEVDWRLATRPNQTVVFYMGLSLLGEITRGLLAQGMPAATPFAVVAKATQADQMLISGTLANIEEQCKGQRIPSPALLVMGQAVTQIRQVPELDVAQQCRLVV